MSRILYLHGSSAGPYGSKTGNLERYGHHIVGRPRLPYPRHSRNSWRWITEYFDQGWFRDAVAQAQESLDACKPDVVVGSSMGGAVAMNLDAGGTPMVLVAPAWRAWFLLRFGQISRVKAATVIVHGDADRTISPRYSRQLLADSRLHGSYDRDLGVQMLNLLSQYNKYKFRLVEITLSQARKTLMESQG